MLQVCRLLEDFADQVHASGRTLLLCGAREQPARLMERAEFHEHLGEANILPNVQAALKRAHDIAAELGLEEPRDPVPAARVPSTP